MNLIPNLTACCAHSTLHLPALPRPANRHPNIHRYHEYGIQPQAVAAYSITWRWTRASDVKPNSQFTLCVEEPGANDRGSIVYEYI